MFNRFSFLLLLGFSCLFLCEGKISPPSNGTNVTVIPGSRAWKIMWSFDDTIESFSTRTWIFTPSDGRRRVGLARINGDGDAQPLTTSYEVAVEKPATLVLKNVNLTYNGTYEFSVTPGASKSDVVVYVAVKPNATAFPSPIIVNEGGDVSCTCQGRGGNPPADVTWYKDNRKIGGTGKEEKTLTLTNVTNEKDHRSYRCVAQSYPNEDFRDEVIVKVIVQPNSKPNKTKIVVPEEAYVGEKLVINCYSEGHPAPSFIITHNVTTKIVSNHSRYVKDKVDYSDAGMYECIAKNLLGTDKHSSKLIVKGAVFPPSNGNNMIFIPGSTEKIVWSFDHDIKRLVSQTWTFTPNDGQQEVGLAKIYGDGDVQILTTSYEVAVEKPATLVLKNVNLTYDGAYRFSLSPGTGLSEVVIYIAVKPKATVCCSPIVVNEGDNVSCACQGQGGNPPADVTWYKDNRKIGRTGKEEKTLTLTNVINEKHHGSYKCVTKSHPSEMFKDEVIVDVTVNYKPTKPDIMLPEKNIAFVGENFTIKCVADGRPKPSYNVTHNGTLVSDEATYFKSTEWDDAGLYTCISSNILGTNSSSAVLIVEDKASSNDTSFQTEWYIIVVTLLAGIIIGILFSYIVSCSRRKFGSRKAQSCPEPRACEVDSTYQELDITKMNTEDNYQSLRVDVATNNVTNDDDSNYSE